MKNRPALSSCFGKRGFSLVELLVALAIGMIVLAAFYGVFAVQNRRFSIEEQVAETQQNVRAGMDTMVMEVKMAGYDPAGLNSDADPANDFDGITVNATQIEIKADLNGDGVISGGDDVIYRLDAANHRITRNSGAGNQPFAENIESFTFAYLDADGNVTATSSAVRQVDLTITGRTAMADPTYPTNGGYRTYTLTSRVVPRNLDYH